MGIYWQLFEKCLFSTDFRCVICGFIQVLHGLMKSFFLLITMSEFEILADYLFNCGTKNVCNKKKTDLNECTSVDLLI